MKLGPVQVLFLKWQLNRNIWKEKTWIKNISDWIKLSFSNLVPVLYCVLIGISKLLKNFIKFWFFGWYLIHYMEFKYRSWCIMELLVILTVFWWCVEGDWSTGVEECHRERKLWPPDRWPSLPEAWCELQWMVRVLFSLCETQYMCIMVSITMTGSSCENFSVLVYCQIVRWMF